MEKEKVMPGLWSMRIISLYFSREEKYDEENGKMVVKKINSSTGS